MDLAKEIFETSTIHGLSYISEAKTKGAKIIWAITVLASFFTAGVLIRNSYRDWASSPISTSISTHPISSLIFPQVTVCPPKGTNTALNYDLATVNSSFSTEAKNFLGNIVPKLFIEKDHIKYGNTLKALTNEDNICDIYKGFQTVPSHLGQNGFVVKINKLSGHITTPGFGGEVSKDDYINSHHYHYILEFPPNIGELLGPTGSLVMKLDVDTREEEGWREWVEYRKQPRYQYQEPENGRTWEEAEENCTDLGGHLASVSSDEYNAQVFISLPVEWRNRESSYVWIGGRKKELEGNWSWSNGQTWEYNDWACKRQTGAPCIQEPNGVRNQCLRMYGKLFADGYKSWEDNNCLSTLASLCEFDADKTITGRDSLTFSYTSQDIKTQYFEIVWRYEKLDTKNDWKPNTRTGFSVSWNIQDKKESTVDRQQSKSSFILPNQYFVTIANMVKTASLIGLDRSVLIKKAIQHKVDTSLTPNTLCNNGQTTDMSLLSAFNSGLNLTTDNIINTNITDETLRLGFQLYSFLIYCPENIREAAYLVNFCNSLLQHHSPRTVLQGVVNTINMKAIAHQQNKDNFHQFYHKLEEIMNLQLSQILVKKFSASVLTAGENQKIPYLTQDWNLTNQTLVQAPGYTDNTLAEMSSHPVHLVTKDGRKMPTAFIPFCAYKTDMETTGQKLDSLQFMACNIFEPTVRDGELCYTFDPQKDIPKNIKTDEGAKGELLLLLDYNEERSIAPKKLIVEKISSDKESSLEEDQEDNSPVAKIYIHTMGRYSGSGAGRFTMKSLKLMSASDNFLSLPQETRGCQVEVREHCQVRTFLERGLRDCGCVPWEFAGTVTNQVIWIKNVLLS